MEKNKKNNSILQVNSSIERMQPNWMKTLSGEILVVMVNVFLTGIGTFYMPVGVVLLVLAVIHAVVQIAEIVHDHKRDNPQKE